MSKESCCPHLSSRVPGIGKRLEQYYSSTKPRHIKSMVKKAARLLDLVSPFDWTQRIDMRNLNMACPQHCILGQIFGNYYDVFYSYPGDRRCGGFLSRSSIARVAWQKEITQRSNNSIATKKSDTVRSLSRT